MAPRQIVPKPFHGCAGDTDAEQVLDEGGMLHLVKGFTHI